MEVVEVVGSQAAALTNASPAPGIAEGADVLWILLVASSALAQTADRTWRSPATRPVG
jgi:hypothetical protein